MHFIYNYYKLYLLLNDNDDNLERQLVVATKGGTIMEGRIGRIKAQLHDASYKLTPQREATVRVLLENEKESFKCRGSFLACERYCT